MCELSECGNTTDYDELAKTIGLFGKDSEDKIDFCSMYPLKNSHRSSMACTPDNFDLSASPNPNYCKDYKKVTYNSFFMKSSVVTDFGLICDNEYMVLLRGQGPKSSILKATSI